MKKIVEKRDDIVFYLKMYPLTSIHPKAYNKSKAIVCEKSIKLLEDAYDKKAIPAPKCETDAIDKNIALAKKLGIRGTPAIILPDGRLLSGNKTAADLIKLIEGKQ
ncbi:MAG: thioredoxin fold domain-containing protein [Nitrospirae bacterium]|nr:thioredoxin fold domain-containing protein [Nitrospirota bacterium]